MEEEGVGIAVPAFKMASGVVFAVGAAEEAEREDKGCSVVAVAPASCSVGVAVVGVAAEGATGASLRHGVHENAREVCIDANGNAIRGATAGRLPSAMADG